MIWKIPMSNTEKKKEKKKESKTYKHAKKAFPFSKLHDNKQNYLPRLC